MSRTATRPSRRRDAGVASSVQSSVPARPVPTTGSAALPAWQLAVAALVPVVTAVLVYLPALRNGFIWDDPMVLDQLRAIQSVRDLFILPAAIPKLYYRPFVFATYLADRWVLGETPFWFHASVIAFHALNTLLVFVLGRRLFPTNWQIAGAGALLFAVFPTHVESVAWMAGRSDVIVCAWVLLSLLLFLDRQRRWSCWLGGLTFFLALLSKEMALAGVLLIPLVDLMSVRRLYWGRYIPLIIATAVYLVLRQYGTGVVVGGTTTEAPVAEVATALLRALGFYTFQTLLPFQLSAYVPEVPRGVGYVMLGLLAAIGSCAGIALAWRRASWPIAFLLVWFWVTLAPSLTVIVRRSASAQVADRYLYVPTVASCLLLAWLLAEAARRWRLPVHTLVAIVLATCLAFGARLVSYTSVWTDNLSFWTDVAVKTPAYTLPHRELATALIERGRLQEAREALQRALAGKSEPEGMAMTYNNLGNLYRRLERYDDAEQAFQKGLEVAPHPMLYHNLGMALMKRIELENQRGDLAAVMRDMAQARTAFETAIFMANAPDAPDEFKEWNAAKSHALLGQILFSLGDRVGARQQLETSLRLEPTGPVADATRQYMRRLQ